MGKFDSKLKLSNPKLSSMGRAQSNQSPLEIARKYEGASLKGPDGNSKKIIASGESDMMLSLKKQKLSGLKLEPLNVKIAIKTKNQTSHKNKREISLKAQNEKDSVYGPLA